MISFTLKLAVLALAHASLISATLHKRANSTICDICSFPARPSRTPTTSGVSNLTTSTIYTYVTYTITSCAATVTKCLVGSLTTETIPLYLTVCSPGIAAPKLPVGPPGSGYPSYSDFNVPSGALPLVSATPGDTANGLPKSTVKNAPTVATNVPPKPPNSTCIGSVCNMQTSGASTMLFGIAGVVGMLLGSLVFFL